VLLALSWRSSGWGDAAPIGLCIAALFFLGGRALRYLLAAE
jgi:hypothetical protein